MEKVFWLTKDGMNNTQKRVFDWLKELEPELGKLYKGAVQLISNRAFPGRGRFICHAVREIRNRLPDAVVGRGDLGRLEYPQEVDALAKVWEQAGLGSVRVAEGDEQGSEHKIPQELVVLLSDLFTKHKAVAGRKRENTTRLLIAFEPENKDLQASLIPVINRWIRETDWFEERAHVGKAINEEDLVAHFETFETGLGIFAQYFYEGFEEIEQLVEKANASGGKPSDAEIGTVLLQLARPKYRLYFFDKLENVHWIGPLRDNGFFQSPPEPKEGEKYERWPEGWYLKKMASKAPEDVLEVIGGIRSRNPFVRITCFECLLAMPENVAVKGVKVVENLLRRRVEEGDWGWFWGGKQAAELMVKLSRSHKEEAFKIAWVLVDAWETGEERTLRDMTAKFKEFDYEELIFKYYNKLFEVDAFKATGILAKILERYVKEASKRGDYDVSSLFYIRMENLEEIDCRMAGILGILVKGICEGGKAVIEKQPDKIGELLDYLEGQDKAVFYRLEMHILRFASKGIETERKNRLIVNRKFLEEPGYEYEYKLLLRDKFEEIDHETINGFVEWVKSIKKSDEERKDIEDWCKQNEKELPDFEKMENYQRAEELYLVRDKFQELYQDYVDKAGVKDESKLAPRRMVGEARHVSPMEGTPLQPEVMAKKKVDEVLDFILEPGNYEGKVKPGEWNSPTEALRATFKEDVKKRPIEYLKEGAEKLENLLPGFLSSFFYGVSETVRDGSFGKEGWADLIELAHSVVESKQKEEKYRNCFSGVLNTLRDGFSERENKIEFDEERVRKFWEIIEPLVHFPIGDKSGLGDERDPVQLSCNMVAGQAMELTVPLGIVCKRELADLYEKYLKGESQKCYEYVLGEIRQPGVNYMFGMDFARIYWTDKEWVEEKIDDIFCDELWDETWGTYVSWSRPSPDGFKLLVEKGKYGKAVEKLGQANKFEFQKNPEEGLVEHLIIGFFNGWIGFDDDLLKAFFEKASAELRGKAARFMTTGFKSVNEEGEEVKEKAAKRMREYWEKRLAAIKDKPEENKDEAIELTGWVEDSVLPAKETLELLEQSLDLSGGKIGKMSDAKDFVEGVRRLGKGNELLALGCLKKAAADENMHMPWADIQDPLVKFLEPMVESPENIQSEAREVVDLYGRYNPEKFRCLWEKLRGRPAN